MAADGPRIAAMDPGSRQAAVIRPDGSVYTLKPPALYLDPGRFGMRLAWFEQRFLELFAGVDVLVVEDSSLGSWNPGQRELERLRGVAQLCASRRDILDGDTALVRPLTLKMYATGSGKSRGPGKVEKADVVKAAILAGFQPHNADEADAWWLWRMARHHYLGDAPSLTEHPENGADARRIGSVQLHAGRERALGVVHWPTWPPR
jgi:hypothetical protein